MKILFVFRDMGTGGAQKIEAFVANEMMDHGFEVSALNMSNTPISIAINNNIKIHNLIYNVPKNKIFSVFYKFFYLFKFRRKVKTIKPDVVCSFLSDIVRITSISLFGLPFKIIGSERGDPNVFTKKQFKAYRRAYKRCDAAVFQLENVKKMYSLKENIRQYVIPNPCVPRTSGFAKREFDDGHTIVSAGRITEQKRFDLLIEAFAIAHNKHKNLKLRIYGDGPLRKQMMEKVMDLGISSNVVFKGDINDVFEDAKNCSFFVLSSDFEGIPNVIMEAMAIGMPCISTDCSPGGARFLLKDGELGVIAKCGNRNDLADKIVNFYENENLRTEYSKKGLMEIRKFDPELISAQWCEVFKNA